MLAFYGGVCDSTVCGLVDMALHPDQAAVGLVIAAANGLSPGLVDAVAPDYSRRAQMTNLAARMHSADPAESARAQGQVAGMVLALLLPFKALRGGGASALEPITYLDEGAPAMLYREGTPRPGNLTPRSADGGALSFRASLSNPINSQGRPVFRLGEPYIAIDASRLRAGTVVPDNSPPGHVSVIGASVQDLLQALVDRGRLPR
jgi:hypothetical protein